MNSDYTKAQELMEGNKYAMVAPNTFMIKHDYAPIIDLYYYNTRIATITDINNYFYHLSKQLDTTTTRKRIWKFAPNGFDTYLKENKQ